MITSRGFYNMKGKDIKRKIDLKNIKAITYGAYGSEFVLHIPDEYDYRYASPDKRDTILVILTDSILKMTGGKLLFYFKEEVCLYKYATTK